MEGALWSYSETSFPQPDTCWNHKFHNTQRRFFYEQSACIIAVVIGLIIPWFPAENYTGEAPNVWLYTDLIRFIHRLSEEVYSSLINLLLIIVDHSSIYFWSLRWKPAAWPNSAGSSMYYCIYLGYIIHCSFVILGCSPASRWLKLLITIVYPSDW